MRSIKLIVAFILLFNSNHVFAQDFTDSWMGHFSYLDIKDISQGETKVYGAAENAIFTYDKQTLEIEKLSTINGLSGETISSIEYVQNKGLLLIGFENGLMQVYKESENDFLTVVDIIDKPTIPPNNKRINHFMIYNDFAYISTDFGISLYDINNLEFGDTYYIGDGGSQIKINQTTIFEDQIYAATNVGISKALVSNPNLIDFNQWTRIVSANWVGITSVNDKLFASRSTRRLYSVINDAISELVVYSDLIVDTREEQGNLLIATEKEAYVYNTETSLNVVATAQTIEDVSMLFTAVSLSQNNNIYIGTQGIYTTAIGQEGYGILQTNVSDTSVYQEIHPESPLLNKFFKIKTQAGEVWGTHGGHSVTYNFNGGLRRSGLSHLKNEEWNNISYDSIASAVSNPWYLSYLSINPFNTNQVYVGSYFSGLLDINTESISIFNQDNSSLVPFAGAIHLVLANNFDSNGALWVMNGRVDNSLNKLENGQWTGINMQDIINPRTSNLGFSDITFTDDGKIFISSLNYGIIGVDTNGDKKFIEDVEFNMPSEKTWTVETDLQNTIWIGTDRGLRVIYNTSEFFSNPTFQVSDIIVLDDGTPRELLFQQYITDIEVDGSNNKWIGTLDTGVYYLSSDGQETIFHFTKDNSPLPSNDILDIAIDDENGLVYFATEKGLVAFGSESSKPEETLEDAYVFPNPVRPSFNINNDKIKIKGLTDNVNIKITDIEGNLVTEAESRTNGKFKGFNLEIDGGTALWNGKNLGNVTVASGVYLIMLTDLDSIETKVLKVMIVR
ncbi:hypothetical protein [Lacinutrix sp. 5H-3-7-4]|uniref:type IX secretion system anionic LPS delivery protein PorZ n=1 Tax=Lacinutrix sp. (strain 5H-3-7-4) TaxID=983544 RepID=UPI00020A346B|nr:hypothetical protein [Lacinutrix sp. 5H-3-7-4]AEH00703.1 putative periplasmic ligand-binding sensor protein [Lacinutrix sp. 5H-3-7-4]